MNESFYNILEVPDTATIDEIKKSYRRLSMLYHPDKNKNNPDATAKFQKISEAYETLGDKDKKKEYDMTRNNPFIKMMNGNNSSSNPVDELFQNLFNMHFNPGSSNFDETTQFSNGFPFAQGFPFTQGFPFGQGGNGPNIKIFHNGIPINIQGFNQKPGPIVKTLIVPIDKILTGTTIPLDIERWIIQDGIRINENETLYVPVPKGIDDGEIIMLKEKGNCVKDDCRGDVKIFIKIENDTEFKRYGLDLVLEKSISIKEALCGFNFELKYITGRKYTITNNSGNIISNGYKKVIPNMGFTRDNHTGNLIIVFNVRFPDKISEESIEKLKNIDF
jgi:DnaJ-class molecular chaperone